MYADVWVYACECSCPKRSKEEIISPGDAVISNSELSDVGVGTQLRSSVRSVYALQTAEPAPQALSNILNK